jgi:hypothetical protein
MRGKLKGMFATISVFGVNAIFEEFNETVSMCELPTNEKEELYVFPFAVSTRVQLPLLVAFAFSLRAVSLEKIDTVLCPLNSMQLFTLDRVPFMFPEKVALMGEPTTIGI